MKKRKKRNLSSKIILFISVFLVLFFVYRSLRGRAYTKHTTVFPIMTVYKQDIEAKAYIIFDEEVFKASGNGIAVYNASEGQKIPAGYEVVSINLMDDVSQLKDELIKLNAAIQDRKSDSPQDTSKNLSNEDINAIGRIQDNIKNRHYSGAILEINNLDLNNKHHVNISELSKYRNIPLEDLENQKQTLLEQISKSNIQYTSKESALVSYQIDGLEEKYKYNDDTSKFTYDYLMKNVRTKSFETKNQVKKDEILFKLINNFRYKICLAVSSNKGLESIKIGDTINVDLDGTIISGFVEDINTEKTKGSVYIIDSTEYLEKIYDKRIHDAKIDVNKEKSYKIPSKSIVTRGKLKGVYVEEIHGLVRFLPVEILSVLGEDTFVSRGNRESKIEVDDKLEKTININDAIVVYPGSVDDFQILN
ncbi:hypothetical protein J2S72_000102 [Peptoniphilus koenoeneniae]|uniref:Membrane fusion protein n=1 Tax=Peptoniphilus koenoeneniae TaxID=507751 RepID=A0ABU0AS64_9FIRM|nr:HlyD family efflux transporter periplasmic adaptor subunit [Peptoniphilus koenoeneniae]MDQ0274106.1 hypothetical protein [Peptoniphilus koenoeneniae]